VPPFPEDSFNIAGPISQFAELRPSLDLLSSLPMPLVPWSPLIKHHVTFPRRGPPPPPPHAGPTYCPLILSLSTHPSGLHLPGVLRVPAMIGSSFEISSNFWAPIILWGYPRICFAVKKLVLTVPFLKNLTANSQQRGHIRTSTEGAAR